MFTCSLYNWYFSGDKTNAASLDFSAILPEEVEREVKEAAEISMGTEVSEQDIENITYLCDQVIWYNRVSVGMSVLLSIVPFLASSCIDYKVVQMTINNC